MRAKITPILSGNFNSNFNSGIITKSKYEETSIQMNVSGDLVFDVELQQSLDGENFVTVLDSARLNQTEAESPLMWDISTGNPKFYKVVVTVVSGSAEVEFFES